MSKELEPKSPYALDFDRDDHKAIADQNIKLLAEVIYQNAKSSFGEERSNIIGDITLIHRFCPVR